MLKNYLLSSLRSISRNRDSWAINFLGLILGFSTVMIIAVYVYRELNHDRFHEKSSRIYRVNHNEKTGKIPGTRHLATVGPPVGPALAKNYEQVENAVRLRYTPDHIMRHGDNLYNESRIFYVDPSIFDVFTFPLTRGDASTALSLPNNVVLTAETTKRYFGGEDPLGKVIRMDNAVDLQVTGVLAPIPGNASFKFDFLLPFEAFKVPFGYPVTLNDWGWISFHTYVLLKPGTDPMAFESQIQELVTTNWPPERAAKFRLELQPLCDIYLGEVKNSENASGNRTYIFVLCAAALLILLIAGFNFTNLFSALCAGRAKEMGVRKIVGAQRRSVGRHILIESVGVCLTAAALSAILLPFVMSWAEANGFPGISGLPLWAGASVAIVMVAVILGVIAGLYPSLLLSRLDFHKLLRGSFRTSASGTVIRRSLVFAQFSISIALVCSVFIAFRQMEYLKKKDLGFAKDELLVLRVPGTELHSKFRSLKNTLMENPDIRSVSLAGGRLDGENGNVPIYTEGNLDEGVPMSISAATFDFFKTIGVNLLAGREISEQNPGDSLRGVLLNEAAVRELGWTVDTALGKKIRVSAIMEGEVIGVVPNFHFASLHDEIAPLVLYYPRTRLEDVFIRFSTTDIPGLISSIEKNWKTVAPELPIDFTFLNEHLQSQYRSEQNFALLFEIFAIVGLTIACLGLYGLISQEMVYRLREIGIRKVLGASVQNVVRLILKPFVILVLLANLVAWPLSFWGMNRWLDEFTYHLPMPWLAFPLAGFAALFVAILTISYKSVQAAQSNPVDSIGSD